jgi:hypothetical protein
MAAHAKRPTIIVLDNRPRRVVVKENDGEVTFRDSPQTDREQAKRKVVSRLKRLHPMD